MTPQDLQRELGVTVDGAIGPRTKASILKALACPDPRPLTEIDVARAAHILDAPRENVWAFCDVESAGRGFHPVSHLPIILYEPHVFHRMTDGRYGDDHPDLSYRRPGQRPYPNSQAARWDQLLAAVALDVDAALQSASWGLFQVMGFQYAELDFDCPWAFALAMARGEGEHLTIFTRHVIANPDLHAAVRSGRWADAARLFNGKDYARNHYDQRLKAAADRRLAA